MEKRYQVFVSSTFRDLEHERSEVIQALLELDCIPCGMELFPAADEDQWSYIQGIIDDCDYYVVVLSGKYGSISPVTGKSYTQMEYEYALSKNIPTIAFLHKNLSSLSMERSEVDQKKRKLLEKFRGDVEQRLCKHWENADQLGAVVSRSMTQLIKARPAVGWVRADRVPDESFNEEIVRLRRHIEELEGQVKNLAPVNLKSVGLNPTDLAQGEDVFTVELYFTAPVKHPGKADSYEERNVPMPLTWDELFFILAPQVSDNGGEHYMEETLVNAIKPSIAEDKLVPYRTVYIRTKCFDSIKTQMRLLNLMDFSEELMPDSVTRLKSWYLTPRGEAKLLRQQAVTRS